MAAKNKTEAHYLLRKLLSLEAADLSLNHAWVWETDRWKELVFALLTRVTDMDEAHLRDITERMNDIGLLDIDSLAASPAIDQASGQIDPHSRHIIEYFLECGFQPEEAQNGLQTVREAAIGLQKHFKGKIQLYLRKYGLLMLQEINQTFEFSKLDMADVTLAFTYWLQNVLEMPVSLLDAHMEAFCKQHDLKPAQVVSAADDLDLNLALLDDLVLSYLPNQTDETPPVQESLQKVQSRASGQS